METLNQKTITSDTSMDTKKDSSKEAKGIGSFTETLTPGIVLDKFGQQHIDISIIKVENRARKDLQDILALRDSVKEFGVLHPIRLRKIGEEYHLVAGGRRLHATTLAGLLYIPFVYDDAKDILAKEVELEENVCRKDLSWPERSMLMAEIHELKTKKLGSKPGEGWSNEKQAALVGVSTETVQKDVRIGRKIKANPKLAEKYGHLPISAALKEIEKDEKTAVFREDHKAGRIEISTSLRLQSCIDGVKQLADRSIACIITDPPFGNSQITQQTGSSRTNMVFTGIISDSDNLDSEKVRNLLGELIPLLTPKLLPGAHLYMFFCFEQLEFIRDLLIKNDFLPEWAPIIWDKGRSTTPPTGYAYPSSYEPILFAHYKERTRHISGDGLRNIITCPPVPRDDRGHRFQKPGMLLSQLIGRSTLEGELLYDPFGGSGSLLHAARTLNRNAVADEVNAENWARAQQFLGSTTPTPKVKNTNGGSK